MPRFCAHLCHTAHARLSSHTKTAQAKRTSKLSRSSLRTLSPRGEPAPYNRINLVPITYKCLPHSPPLPMLLPISSILHLPSSSDSPSHAPILYLAISSKAVSCRASSIAMPSIVTQKKAIHPVPSACSSAPPPGRGLLRSNTPMLSSPRKPPPNRFLPLGRCARVRG